MAAIETTEAPRSVAEAAATLDRIARHCLYDCPEQGACVDPSCEAARIELAAALYLVGHWEAAQD